jgi:hypothetical protein
MKLIIDFMLVLVVLFASIALHELGHLFFGKIAGFKFGSIQFGSIFIFRRDEKIHFENRKSFKWQCLMIHPKKKDLFHLSLYNLGGLLVNFFITIFSLLHYQQSTEIAMLGLINFVILITNALPICVNDGFNQKALMQTEHEQIGFINVVQANYLLLLNDFDAIEKLTSDFVEPRGTFGKTLFNLRCIALEANDQLTMDEIQKAGAEIQTINEQLTYYGLFLGHFLKRSNIDKISHDEVTRIYQKFTQLKKSKLQAFALYHSQYLAYIDGNFEQSKKYTIQAEKMLAFMDEGPLKVAYQNDLKELRDYLGFETKQPKANNWYANGWTVFIKKLVVNFVIGAAIGGVVALVLVEIIHLL